MTTALTRLWLDRHVVGAVSAGSGRRLWQVSVTSSDGGKLIGHDQFKPLNAARHPVASWSDANPSSTP